MNVSEPQCHVILSEASSHELAQSKDAYERRPNAEYAESSLRPS
jgi:hypothetical protein